MPASPWIGSTRNAAVFRRDRTLERVRVAVRHRRQARRKRTEAVAVLRLRRQAGDRDRAAVEVAVARDDRRAAVGNALDLVAPFARRLDRGLDRFRAAAGRQHAIEAGDARQSLHQLRQPVVVVGARRHRELLRLLDQRADDARMRVTEAHRRVRAHQVEQPATFDVGDPRALAARQHDGQRLVVVCAGLLLTRDQRLAAREGFGAGERGDISRAGTLLHAETPCERCRARANRSVVHGRGRVRRSSRGSNAVGSANVRTCESGTPTSPFHQAKVTPVRRFRLGAVQHSAAPASRDQCAPRSCKFCMAL